MERPDETTADIIAEMRRDGVVHNSIPTKYLNDYADRLEAAHKRERESITPKPEPDWKDICAKCKDGDIEPKHCEYYGEPNGCNSPTYGEHPTAEKSSAVGDCAKLRDALEDAQNFLLKHCCGSSKAQSIVSRIDCALSAPPRNCDVGTAEEQNTRHNQFCYAQMKRNNHCCVPCPCYKFVNGEVQSCTLLWAQLPYKEGGAK